MKKYLFGILAVALAIGFSAFTTKKAHKPFTSKTFYYVNNAPNQRIESGVGSPTAVYLRSLQDASNPNALTTAGNWQEAQIVANADDADGSSYVLAFTIDNYEAESDGNDLDGISLAEALTFMNFSSSTYPATTSVVIDADVNHNSTVSAHLTNFTRADDGRD